MSEPIERGVRQQVTSYYDLWVPDASDAARESEPPSSSANEAPDGFAAGPRPLLVATHGYGGDKASMMRAARRAAPGSFAVASLQGTHQHIVYPEDGALPLKYGFGWLTNFKPEESIRLHHRAVREIVETLAGEGIVDAGRVFLYGFSQSVALNFRFAFTYPGLVRGVVAVCGGIPGNWKDPEAFRSGDVDVLYVAGERDLFYPPDRIERYAAALRERARAVDVRSFDEEHKIPRASNAVVSAWLAERVAARKL